MERNGRRRMGKFHVTHQLTHTHTYDTRSTYFVRFLHLRFYITVSLWCTILRDCMPAESKREEEKKETVTKMAQQ